jgi:hypothetical protein
VTIGEVSEKLARVPKTVCYSSRKRPETDVFAKNKIRTRLARRPTLVVLCLKLWSVRGEGTVRVTKCVILASVWASNCLLGKVTKWPVKGLERGPYGPKINGNLIKCHLQRFCDYPGGFHWFLHRRVHISSLFGPFMCLWNRELFAQTEARMMHFVTLTVPHPHTDHSLMHNYTRCMSLGQKSLQVHFRKNVRFGPFSWFSTRFSALESIFCNIPDVHIVLL